jgi:hypothetical protein
MTYRCLELLDLPASEQAMVDDDDEDEEEDRVRARPSYLLDIGAGSGLSGEILTEEGHQWVGMDVSGGMLGQSLALVCILEQPDTDAPTFGQRSHSSAKSKATSCSPTSGRESRSDRVLSTAQSRESRPASGLLCDRSGVLSLAANFVGSKRRLTRPADPRDDGTAFPSCNGSATPTRLRIPPSVASSASSPTCSVASAKGPAPCSSSTPRATSRSSLS